MTGYHMYEIQWLLAEVSVISCYPMWGFPYAWFSGVYRSYQQSLSSYWMRFGMQEICNIHIFKLWFVKVYMDIFIMTHILLIYRIYRSNQFERNNGKDTLFSILYPVWNCKQWMQPVVAFPTFPRNSVNALIEGNRSLRTESYVVSLSSDSDLLCGCCKETVIETHCHEDS